MPTRMSPAALRQREANLRENKVDSTPDEFSLVEDEQILSVEDETEPVTEPDQQPTEEAE